MAYNSNLQIAAGHNNAGGLTAIESALTNDVAAQGVVQSWGNFSPGLKKIRSDGTIYVAGYPSTSWLFSIMSFTQYYDIQNTYCGGAGSFDGLVTIRTNSVRHNTYANWNATLLLPHPNEVSVSSSRAYLRDVRISFIRMVAI